MSDHQIAIPFARVDTFTKKNGETGWRIACKLCRQQGRSWSTDSAAKRLMGRDGKGINLREDAMDLWTVHMQVHHPQQPPPDWQLADDVDQEVFDSDARFHVVTREEMLLREIFGDQRPDPLVDNPCPVCMPDGLT